MYPLAAMELDSSDSDGSHVSATPPRNPSPKPNLKPSPRILPTHPKPKTKTKYKPKPKPSVPPPPLPSTPPPPPPPPPDLPSTLPDLSTLGGHCPKIRSPFEPDPTRSASFLFKPRRPIVAADPPEPEQILAEKINPPMEVPPKPKKSHLNLITPNVPFSVEPKPLMKCSNEGNFVRYNINGYGRRYSYKNAKRKSFNSYSSSYSRNKRFRRRKLGNKPESGDAAEEADDFVSGFESEDGLECGELVSEALLEVRKEVSDENLGRLLKLVFGFDSFKEGQLEAIKKVIAGESTMLVLPTGAGKSLCYQLPALVLPGVTLVVSPLVALMVDQLRQLPAVIRGALLSSSQTSEESTDILKRLREGKLKVLFVSPERFINTEFVSICGDSLPISLIVIDEAHCISEWSHNFRPSYLRLRASLLRPKFDVQCFVAMTATATTQTLCDILHALEIPPANVIQTCQIRENLKLFVTLSQNRLKDLLMLMKSPPVVDMRSIIIYCKFQAETDILCKHLCDNNIPAKGYHSGIPAKNRSRIQELFCSNKIRVIVATVAFGMGLDKRDVEAVIHYSLPESLEEYVQETGRAGRDGRLACCHLFLDNSTYYKLRSLLYSDGVDEYMISRLLSHIFSSDKQLPGSICSLIKESASRKFDMKEEVILTILTQLEMGDVQYLCLLPQLNVTCSVYFHKTVPEVLSEKDILVATILKKSETKHGDHVFDVTAVANSVAITAIDLLKWLQKLKSVGEITFEVKDPAFCYMVIKTPSDFCSLTTQLTKWLSEVESCKVRKLDEMFHVANFALNECKRTDGCSNSLHTACIQNKILDYFSRDTDALCDFSVKMKQNSRFMRADIKVFLQSNSHAKFTPRAVARIMHGIPSPAFPSATWSKCHFWGRYIEIDFSAIMEAATLELRDFVKNGGTCMV